MRTNTVARNRLNAVNDAGTLVRSISDEKQLSRLTLANMLWEDQFYVDGVESAKRITDLVQKLAKTNPKFVEHLAIAARSNFKLRHVPLLITRGLAQARALRADVLNAVIQRPDEMGEFLSLYWKDGKVPIANQVKKGLSLALNKFSEYQLAKWDGNKAQIRLRDVLFLTHAKPKDAKTAELFRRLADQALETPDTWETQLSAGADKRETFERLMAERKLGALAFLRNLRNMVQAGVDERAIRAYGATVNAERVLPFRYIAAARIVPQFEDMLEQMMFRSLESHEKIPGKTTIMVDCSGSMFGCKVTSKSDLDRFDAASALAMLCREVCEEVEIYGFSTNAVRVPARRGFALVEAIRNSTSGGTAIGASFAQVPKTSDRYIIITDEQSYDRPAAPPKGSKGYLINVAAYQNGVNHSDWLGVDGFSEAVIDYIQAVEKSELEDAK